MRVLVFGGTGAIGRWVVRDLTESDGVELVTVADHDGARALETAGWAAARAGGNGSAQVGGMALALDLEPAPARAALRRALGPVDVVCDCAGTGPNPAIMEACADTGTHYVDLGVGFEPLGTRRALHQRFRDAGVTAVLGMGASPGTTSLMAALAARELDEVDRVEVRLGLAGSAPAGTPLLDGPMEDAPDDAVALWVRLRGRRARAPVEVLADCLVLPHPDWRAGAWQLANGVPASVVAQLLAAGVIAVPGVFAPEEVVPPEPYFAALRRRHMTVSLRSGVPAVA